MAWQKVSSPLNTVVGMSRDSVFKGSTRARSGFSRAWATPDLALRLGMSKIATPVASEPVPEVVGMATRGRKGAVGVAEEDVRSLWYRW